VGSSCTVRQRCANQTGPCGVVVSSCTCKYSLLAYSGPSFKPGRGQYFCPNSRTSDFCFATRSDDPTAVPLFPRFPSLRPHSAHCRVPPASPPSLLPISSSRHSLIALLRASQLLDFPSATRPESFVALDDAHLWTLSTTRPTTSRLVSSHTTACCATVDRIFRHLAKESPRTRQPITRLYREPGYAKNYIRNCQKLLLRYPSNLRLGHVGEYTVPSSQDSIIDERRQPNVDPPLRSSATPQPPLSPKQNGLAIDSKQREWLRGSSRPFDLYRH
jgi:hypothetical protein